MRLTSKQYDIQKNVARNHIVHEKCLKLPRRHKADADNIIYLLHYVIIALSTKDTLLFLLKNV